MRLSYRNSVKGVIQYLDNKNIAPVMKNQPWNVSMVRGTSEYKASRF